MATSTMPGKHAISVEAKDTMPESVPRKAKERAEERKERMEGRHKDMEVMESRRAKEKAMRVQEEEKATTVQEEEKAKEASQEPLCMDRAGTATDHTSPQIAQTKEAKAKKEEKGKQGH